MDASKITITEETRQALARPMSEKKRHKLQVEAAKAYVRSQPTGTIIPMYKIAAAAGIKKGTAHWFCQRLIKEKALVWHKASHEQSGSWSVYEDMIVKSTPPKSVPKPEEQLPTPPPAAPTGPTAGKDLLLNYAKEFAWVNNSDSLREFIKWMEGRV